MIGFGSQEILTAMITPAVLISASGTLVLSTSNRLTRVVDRVRTLAKESKELAAAGERTLEHEELVARQLPILTARVSLLRTAMTVLYSAIGLFIMTSMAIGILGALGRDAAWIPTSLALGGTAFLLYASWLLVREARMAVISTLDEMEQLRASIDLTD